MNGFTSGERSRAKQWLIEEMNEVAIRSRPLKDFERKDDTLHDTQPSASGKTVKTHSSIKCLQCGEKVTKVLKEILKNLLKMN